MWLMFELGRGRVISHEEILDNSGEFPVYSSQTENNGEMGALNTFDFEGDYLTWTTDGANAGTVFRRAGKFNCTNVCGTLKPSRNEIDLGYMVHAVGLSTSSYVRQDINPKLMNNVMAKIRVPVPPLVEQSIIASLLDQETSKIDALITEQQRLIELLKEKRQAVISHAVTKGLNPDVRMKPSGVEWLGEVPEHWALKRLKHVSPFIAVGIVINPTSFVSEDDEGLPFIYGGDIREGVIDYHNSRRISEAASLSQEKTVLSEGDLLTVRVGAPGVTAVVPKECEGGNCASVMLMRKGAFNSQWLCYVMNSRIVRYQVEVVQYGAAQQQFNIAHAVDFLVPVPPLAEQDKLVAALNAKIEASNRLQVEAERAISLLQERRTALISAAVTGKIDVRNYASIQKDAA